MSKLKDVAIRTLDNLVLDRKIDSPTYSELFDAICEIDTLKDRDEQLEALWADFADVPYDSDTETITEDFECFKAGTSRNEIWHWFDERHSKGVVYLLYADGRGTCYVLSSNDYIDGENFEVFFHEADAKKAIQGGIKQAIDDLNALGYNDPIILEMPTHAEVYVANTDIFYEWRISPSSINIGD